VRATAINGPIRIGDKLTTSPIPGHVMKATKPGMILGYALDNANATTSIDMFLNVGYDAGSTLKTDGTLSILDDDLLVNKTGVASSTAQAVDSYGLTFRGSVWDAVTSTAVNRDFTLFTDVVSATSSFFTVRTSSTNIFALSTSGTLTLTGDLSLMGRIYPSARGTYQQKYYIYVDDTSSTNQYISTNADGWQAQTSYDLAERYYSDTELEAGDLVMPSETAALGVVKAVKSGKPVMGIVSSKPGFLLGRSATSTYPIALSGRVPTKVSTQNGAIQVGDLLAVSDIPGVAVKATENGYVVGIALEAYDGADIGAVETFVAPYWYGGFGGTIGGPSAPAATGDSSSVVKRGFADIAAGSKKVHVGFASLNAYPNASAQPYGDAGDWWIENITDSGFDIVLRDALPRDIRFAWRAEPTQAGEMLFNSDGTFGSVDPTTGIGPAMGPGVTVEPPSSTEPIVPPPAPPDGGEPPVDGGEAPPDDGGTVVDSPPESSTP
jgi:hypothetical protein